MPDPRPLRPGDPARLGGFRLIGLLGEGGQGVVYLAEPEDGEPTTAEPTEEVAAGEPGPRRYAIKLLRTHLSGDPKARRYFAKEVAAAQRIDPAYTARIIEADVDGETPYIVSEYVDGRPLADVVREDGPLPGPELDRLAVGTLNALVAIHRAGVVHRDFKPNNVLLDPDRPRVIDFGIARAMDATMSVSSGVVGTPVYMAPEQLTGQHLTPAVDVFAWAATLVFAGTGAPPFGQDSIPAVMHRILNAEPDIGDLPEPLRELVWRSLRRNPAQRPTAQEALARLSGAGSAAVHPAPPGAEWAAPTPPPVPVPPAGPSPFAAAPVPPRPPVPYPPSPLGQAGPPPPGWTPTAAATRPGGATTRPPGAVSGGTGRRSRAWLPLAAAAASVVLVAGTTVAVVRLMTDGDPPGPPTPTTAGAGAGAALTGVVRPSDVRGGTLRLVNSGDFDSLDPGDMYLASSWDFSRLYARPLVTYAPGPGTPGGRLTPDLASGLGRPSADLKTWTYRLRPGLKFEDGTPVTATDVRYAVARTFAVDKLFIGPSYFRDLLDAGDYAGPYKDGDLDGFSGVTTPDDQTVVFHLKQPYAEFDHLAALPQTAPVPRAKDTVATGTDDATRPISTGPYKVESHQKGKSIALSRNPYWTADGIRKQLVDRIEVTLNVGDDVAGQRLLAGEADLDVSGTGLRGQSVTRVLADPNLKNDTDGAPTGILRYIALPTKVAPFDNVHCRRAVQHAVDRTALVRTVFGGPQVAEAATNVLPPVIAGRQRFDPYPLDEAKAKTELAACGRPGGFGVRIAIRADRPKDAQVAEVLTHQLGRVGIRLEIKRYPVGEFLDQVGRPGAVHSDRLGMIVSGWGADYPAGLGFLPLLVDGRRILPDGNANVAELNDPGINAMLDQAARTADRAAREQLTAELDHKVMDSAAILPLAYDKALLYRGSRLTNVYVNRFYGMYDYASLGVR